MKEIRTKFMEEIERTSNVVSYRFQPEEPASFSPGQFLQVVFDEKDRKNGAMNKYLSFSNSPTKEDYIEVTKKISDSKFSRKLESLEPGAEVLLKGPMGRCVLEETDRKIGFLVGGIGITPVISMVEYMADKDLSTDMVLMYSNWTENDIAFKKELDAWSEEKPNLKVFHTVVSAPPKNEAIHFGMIDKFYVQHNVPDYTERLWFIFGPPGMVTAMREICRALMIPDEQIIAESFMGY